MIYLEISDGHIREFNLLKSYLKSINEPYEVVFKKDIERNKIKVTKDDVADGTIQFIYDILKKSNKQIPVIDSYPQELNKFLYRTVVKTKLFQVSDSFTGFIKPAEDLKKWTGFVINNISEFYYIRQHNRNTIVYISSIVNFVTEWRFYVINKQIAARGNYDGDKNIFCDENVVQEAITLLENTPSAFCIDFGVLDTGKTALVEYNDAFSVGWYLDDQIDVYFELIKTRFQELMQ